MIARDWTNPTATPTVPPSTRTPAPTGGPLRHYLRDPGATLHDVLAQVREWVTGPGLIAGSALAGAVVTAAAGRAWWRRHCQQQLDQGARLVTILAPPSVDPSGAQALWANLVGPLRPAWRRQVGGQPHVVFEYQFSADGLTLRMWVPGPVPPGMVERAIEAAWPGAHTATRPVDRQLRPTGERAGLAVGGELRLGRSEVLPIRTDFDADPLRALLGAPVGLAAHEQATVQVLARPVTGRRVARARRAARQLNSGRAPRRIGRLLDLLTPHPPRLQGAAHVRTADAVAALERSAQNRAVVAKQRGALFETRIRYAVTSSAPLTGRGRRAGRAGLDPLRGRGHALASAFAGFGEHNGYRRHRLRHPALTLQARRLGRGDLLSVPELAALAHLPADEAAPGLARAGARAVAPPPAIPTPGPNTPQVRALGVADAGHRRPVGLAVADARHHVHLLGATGSGKSTLLAQLILADAAAGRGAVVIDPKGDLITDVLDRLPTRMADRLVLLDAQARTRPPCLNPLDDVAGGSGPDLAVDNIVSIFARVYAAYWGPRTEDILRAACLTLRAQPHPATLADLPRLLGEPAYRARAVRAVRDPVLRGFWAWYEQLSPGGQAQAIAPLLNKLRAFLLRPFVKAALAGGPSTVDLRAVLDSGGLLLARLPKGSLGDETTRLIGSLIVARAWQAATARARLPQHHRPDAGLYIDECHNFLNLAYPLEDMLAEARGFRLAMILAHQHLDQLSPGLRQGISANARNKIYFASSPGDARELARHTGPRLAEHDLAHLGAFHAAARLVVNGDQLPAFTFMTQTLPAPIPGRRRAVRRALHESSRPARSRPAAERDGRRVADDPRRNNATLPAA
jgi:hypothetical protein